MAPCDVTTGSDADGGADEERRRKSNLKSNEGGKEGRPPEEKRVHFEDTSKVEGEDPIPIFYRNDMKEVCM